MAKESAALFARNRAMYGERIRRFRLERGLTQPQLAERVGVKKNAVSNWEAGRSRPDIDSVPALCAALGVSPADFFAEGEGLAALSDEERALLERWRRLSARDRYVLDRTLNAMLDARAGARSELVRLFRNEARTAAGTGAPLADGVRGEFAYLYADEWTRRADEIITVTGDSMEPTYRDGEELLVEHTPELREGEIGIFVVNGDGFVKEYRRDGLHSHNPAYHTIRFSGDDRVTCVGRVLGAVRSGQYADDAEIEAWREARRGEERKGRR